MVIFGLLGSSGAPLAAPSGVLAAHLSPRPPPGGRHGDPRNSACLPALAHTGRLVLASRAGIRTRPLRDAAVAHLHVAEGAPGDLAGALAPAHGGLGSAPPAGPAGRRRALRDPSRRASRPRRGAGPSGPPRAWRRPARPRRRGRGRRRHRTSPCDSQASGTRYRHPAKSRTEGESWQASS